MKKHHAVILSDSFKFVVQRLIPRIQRLAEHGFEIHVIARNDETYLELPDNVYVRKLPANAFSAPLHLLLIQSYFIEIKPTLVHAFGTSSSILSSLAAQTVDIPALVVSLEQPTLLSQDSPLFNWLPLSLAKILEHNPLDPLLSHKYFAKIFEKAFSKVNLFITHSPQDRSWITQLTPNLLHTSCICVNADGVGIDISSPPITRPTSNEIPDHGKRNNTFHVATIIENSNNYDWPIEVIIETLGERFDTHVHIGIFSDNPSLDRFRRIGRYHSIDTILLNPLSTYHPHFFANCDLYLDLNSNPNPIHIMHAMTSSTPVISSPSHTISYMLREDFDLPQPQRLLDNGGTTCPRDKDSWNQLISTLLDHPNELIRAREKARQLATQSFSQDKIDYQILSHYDHLLKDKIHHENRLEMHDLLRN